MYVPMNLYRCVIVENCYSIDLKPVNRNDELMRIIPRLFFVSSRDKNIVA